MAYGVRVCCFHDADGESRCGRWRWEFSKMFGPTFVRKNGEPLKNQPEPREPPRHQHPAWVAFEEWLSERNANSASESQK